jgi:hypothetical protein
MDALCETRRARVTDWAAFASCRTPEGVFSCMTPFPRSCVNEKTLRLCNERAVVWLAAVAFSASIWAALTLSLKGIL